MKTTLQIILLSIGVFSFSTDMSAQVLLQLEKFNNPKTEKYYPGYTLIYKDKSFPKIWQKQTIVDIKDKEQIIVFEDSYISINDIIAVKKPRPFIKYISNGLYVFSANWFLIGGIATLADKYDFTWRDAIIGGTALVTGWIIGKFYYKTTKLNKKNRLRILDLSWPDPQP